MSYCVRFEPKWPSTGSVEARRLPTFEKNTLCVHSAEGEECTFNSDILPYPYVDPAQKCVATVYENNGKVEKYTGCVEKNITQYCGMNVDLTALDLDLPIKMKVKELFG